MNGKILTIIVIGSLLTLSFSPIVSSSEENLQNVLVEVNGEQYQVELSEDEISTIGVIVSSLQNQLQQVQNKEEATQHLRESLTELEEIGIIQGISVERLTNQIMHQVLFREENHKTIPTSNSLDATTLNTWCSLLIGSLTSYNSYSFSAASLIMPFISMILALLAAPLALVTNGLMFLNYYLLEHIEHNALFELLDKILYPLSEGCLGLFALFLIGILQPVGSGLLIPVINLPRLNILTFGCFIRNGPVPPGSNKYPTGHVTSYGVLPGIVSGRLKGGLKEFQQGIADGVRNYYAGIYGFTGITLELDSGCYFIGSGLRTCISEV